MDSAFSRLRYPITPRTRTTVSDRASYRRVACRACGRETTWNAASVFSTIDESVYVRDVGHLVGTQLMVGPVGSPIGRAFSRGRYSVNDGIAVGALIGRLHDTSAASRTYALDLRMTTMSGLADAIEIGNGIRRLQQWLSGRARSCARHAQQAVACESLARAG